MRRTGALMPADPHSHEPVRDMLDGRLLSGNMSWPLALRVLNSTFNWPNRSERYTSMQAHGAAAEASWCPRTARA